MKIAAYIIAGIIAVYLMLVIPAGIAVLISERRFRNSPDRDAILSIIEYYKQAIRGWSADEVAALMNRHRREVMDEGGVSFSVDLNARAGKKTGSYTINISVGRMQAVTVGHSESMEVTFSE